jgi:hypothetical protein
VEIQAKLGRIASRECEAAFPIDVIESERATSTAVIVRHRVGAFAPPDDRLRRTIQYPEKQMLSREAAAYWILRFRGG